MHDLMILDASHSRYRAVGRQEIADRLATDGNAQGVCGAASLHRVIPASARKFVADRLTRRRDR